VITATLDDETAEMVLDPKFRADGATFNRFGMINVMKSADGGGEIYFDDVLIRKDGLFVLPELQALNPDRLA
jgi:hypothetical protein